MKEGLHREGRVRRECSRGAAALAGTPVCCGAGRGVGVPRRLLVREGVVCGQPAVAGVPSLGLLLLLLLMLQVLLLLLLLLSAGLPLPAQGSFLCQHARQGQAAAISSAR